MKAIATLARLGLTATLLWTASCSRLAPSGFWLSYRSELITTESSKVGGWGGYRWMLWESPTAGTFVESEVREFAVDHGWKIVERTEHSVPGHVNPHATLIATPSVVLKCETGLIRWQGEENVDSPAFGYVQLSKDGRQLAINHYWGER